MPKLIIFIYREGAEAYLQRWDAMEQEPMGGTEASALHIASAFQRLGYDVTVTNQVRDLMNGCDIFISVRGWEIFARGIKPGKLNYLWCTDDIDQPFVQGLADRTVAARTYRTVDGVMLLSHYQTQRWSTHLHVPADKAFLTANGIPARHFERAALPAPKQRERWCYYGSTPFRGLEHLLSRWGRIHEQVPGARLHVFSSMQIYGAADTPEFERLYSSARTLPGVEYHGARGQAAIRAVSRHCRALAYPCVFAETSCITAMEAMASGCAVVSTALGALPETAAGNPLVAPTAGWLDRWETELVRVLQQDDAYAEIAERNLELTARRDWSRIAQQWVQRFHQDSLYPSSTRSPMG